MTGVRSLWRRIAMAGWLAIPIAVQVASVAPAAAEPTPIERVKIWSANLNQFRDSEMKLVTNMVGQYNRPDFVALQGVKSGELDDFMEELQRKVDKNGRQAAYRAMHGDRTDPNDLLRSNVGIIWDSSRFTFAEDERWLDVVQKADGCRSETDHTAADASHYSLAIKFNDTKNADRSIVVASIHIDAGGGCKRENVAKIDQQIEVLPGGRRLTLVAGDFNMSPQQTDGEACTGANYGANRCTAPPETNPDCWYQNLSVVLPNCDGAARLHSYVDTVAVEAAASADPDALCAQWTRGRDSRQEDPVNRTRPGVYDFHLSSSYCHDYLMDGGYLPGSSQQPNRIRDRNRIDYIWARWEDAQGNPITAPVSTPALAAAQVAQASADLNAPNPGDPSDRYSDHRAVYAAVNVFVN